MKDFRSVKQRDDRMESPCFGRQSNTAQPELRRGAIPPCSSNAGIDPLSEFIRWEIITCNVIYLERNPSPSEQPAHTANVLEENP
jgi:hypothetical protein